MWKTGRLEGGNCEGNIFKRIMSCQLIKAGCDILLATITVVTMLADLLAICTFAVPSTLTDPPLAVYRFTDLLLFTFSLSRSAVSLDRIVWVQPVSGKQLTKTPACSRPAGASHNGACGVGMLCSCAV